MPGLGSLTVYLNSNSTGLERGLARAEGMLKKFAGMAAGYMAVSSIKQLAEESLKLAGIQEKAENMMARTLKNTAGMAEFTVGELKRWAGEAQNLSIFGDEKVMEAQNRLMQMNSVTGDAFRKTRQVALDLASATGQDLTAVMQTLGKAMQDPVKGIKQLREFGTDPAMKEQIEQVIAAEGREAAQLAILADLQKRYRGAAEEAANTISGAFIQNQNALGDFKEGIGFLINEVFGVQDLLKTSASWFSKWAAWLRDHAAEIGYAFRSVWNDIKFGAQKLYLFVAPIINQISSVVEAAAKNIIEFYQAIPRLLNGEDFQMKLYTPAYNLLKEYQQFGEKFDQLTRDQAAAQGKIDKEFSLKMSKQTEQNIARGAADGTKKGMEQAVKDQQKHQFENPAAIEGSQDAWKIITAAMNWRDQNKSASAALPVSAIASTSAPSDRSDKSVKSDKTVKSAINPAPVAANVPTVSPVKLFNPQVSATTVSSRDMMQNWLDTASIFNPVLMAGRIIHQSITRPQSYRTAYDVATAPQAQQENIGTRALMAFTSFFDSRNNGARFAADAASPITKEQVKLAREQLAAQKETNRELKKFSLSPANLFGGLF